VDGRVAPEVGGGRSDHTDHGSKTQRSPAVVISERGEGFLSGRTWSHHPKHDEESEKAKDMQNHGNALKNWHLPNGGGVENDGAGNVSNCEQRAVPAFDYIVW
jgi:hypothetical protein